MKSTLTAGLIELLEELEEMIPSSTLGGAECASCGWGPACRALSQDERGHTPDCKLAQLLKELKKDREG